MCIAPLNYEVFYWTYPLVNEGLNKSYVFWRELWQTHNMALNLFQFIVYIRKLNVNKMGGDYEPSVHT